MHPLKVSLEELYNGVTKKRSLAKNVMCSKCDGCAPAAGALPRPTRLLKVRPSAALCRKGSKSGNTGTCKGCQGAGVKVHIRQIAPGMVQQMQSVCPECRGQGVLSPTPTCCRSAPLH